MGGLGNRGVKNNEIGGGPVLSNGCVSGRMEVLSWGQPGGDGVTSNRDRPKL